jgi:hypothetical protein
VGTPARPRSRPSVPRGAVDRGRSVPSTAARVRGTGGAREAVVGAQSPMTLAMMLRWMSFVPPNVVAIIECATWRAMGYSVA